MKMKVLPKLRILKKSLFFSALLFGTAFSVQAQMIDLMGSMAVGGAQMAGSVQSVGQMNNRLQINQFLSQLQMKIAEISMTYLESYQNMPIQSMHFGSTKVVFRVVNQGQNYEAFISPMTQNLCTALLQNSFDNLVSVRVMSDDSFQNYTPQQAASNVGLCITANAVALILR